MTDNSPSANGRAYRVIRSQEDGEFVGLCDDFPSLSWLAPDERAALIGIRQLVEEISNDLDASTASPPPSSPPNPAH
jgi:hypothetical protein